MDALHSEKHISTKDASEFSGYSSDHLSRLARSGEIEAIRVGHTWLISRESLLDLLKKQGRQAKVFPGFISTKDASKEYGYSPDYLARLARSGEVKGSQIGRTWLIDRNSLESFSKTQEERKEVRTRELAREREIEYKTRKEPQLQNVRGVPVVHSEKSVEPIPSPFVFSHSVSPFALVTALLVVGLGSLVAQAGFVSQLEAGTASVMQNAATGFAITFGGIPSQFAAQVNSAAENMRPLSAQQKVLAAQLSSSRVSPYFAHPDNLLVALVAPVSFAGRSIHVTPIDFANAGKSALQVAQSAISDTVAFVSSPVQIMSTLADASHALIRADVSFAYGLAAAGPESARRTVVFIGGTGGMLVRTTATVASGTKTILAKSLSSAGQDGIDNFIALTNTVSQKSLSLIEIAGRGAYTGAVWTRTFAPHAPSILEDVYLGILGKSAVVLEKAVRSSSTGLAAVLTAVAPGLSISEQIALATYQTIHGLFDSMTSQLAFLFGPAPQVVVVSNSSPARLPFAPSTTSITAPTPIATFEPPSSIRQTVNTYPTYTTIVQGVSPDFVNQSLLTQRNDILARVFDMIKPLRDISNLIVRNGDLRGGTFDNGIVSNGISVAATTGNFGSLTAGDTTITGDLTVSGTITPAIISAGTYITAPYFVATSTTATSTFAGSLNIDNGGLVYATSTRNVGIGILSPAALLAIQNSTSTQPIFVASNAAGTEVYRITNNGFVGIGTTSPAYALAVEGSSSLGNQVIAGYFTATTSTATSTFAGSLAVGTTTPWGNGLFTVGTSTPLLYVSSNTGHVGIGTTSPDDIFVVRGTGTSDLAEFYSGTGAPVFKVFNNGRIGIGTTTADATLSILQNANGVPIISAYRATDAAPSGDFISYKTAAGATLFRVDNSGNLLAGGIINTGSQTITSMSTPQFRIQYDPSNEITTSVTGTGAASFGINGSAPSLTFTPQSNSANTFNFTNALGTNSILSIDTLNQRVGISNVSPAYKLDVTGNGHFTSYVDAANFVATSSSATSLFNGALTVVGNSLFSNATSTSFFATTASSTNLSSQAANVGTFAASGASTFGSTLGITGLATFTNGFLSLASSTISSGLFSMNGGASTTAFTNSGSTWLTSLSASSLIATDANKMLVSTTSIGVNNLALAKGNFLVGNDAGVAQATSTIFISSTGNVGIGTTNPGANLDVWTNSTSAARGIYSTQVNSGAQAAQMTFNKARGTAGSLTTVADGDYTGVFGFNNHNGTNYLTTAMFGAKVNGTVTTGSVPTDLFFATSGGTTDTDPYGNSHVRMLISSAGNVGIGTTSPSTKFSVGGAAGDTTGHGYFTGGLGVGVVNTTAGTLQTSGAATIGGTITSGLINGQTISSATSFTGTVNAVTGYKVNGAAASGNVLRGDGTNFVSATLGGSDITGAALTKTDDTNITLTLGGTPATALLRAASLTLGWTGQLSVARGGTSVATFATNGVLYGNAATSILATAAGTSAQLLVANGSGVPTFVTMSSDATLANTGALTLATVATGATTGSSTTIPIITFNNKGLVTGVTTAAVIAPAGTLSGATLNSGVTASSLTSVGTLTSLTLGGALSMGSNTITSGLINGQTISSAANFTGTMNAVGTITAPTFSGNLSGQFNNGSIYSSPTNANTFNSGYGQASDNADIWINYRGYNDGQLYFRDFRVGNGKGGQIALFQGSTGNLTLAGTVTGGTYNGQTISSAANFTGTVNATGAITASQFNGSGAGLTGYASSLTSGATNFVNGPDGDRNAATKLPTTSPKGVRYDFVGAGTTGTGGSYAGLMTYAPWDGTTGSTGDASYQLAFGSTAANGGGIPQLNIRKGIDSTWNSWYTILHSGNYNSYSPTLTGGGASGNWAINSNGLYGSPNITTGTITSGLINGQTISSAANFTGTMNINGLIYGNSKEIFNTGDAYLRLNQSNSFSSGIWMSNSNFMGGSGVLAMGSNGGTTNSRVYINGGTYNGTNVIAIDGSNGNITASQFNGSGAGLTGTAASLTAGSANAVSFNGGLTTGSSPTFAGLTVSGAVTVGGTSSRIYMNDSDESTGGAKSLHANSNVIGFLSGAGSWLSYWDTAGNQQNTGQVTASQFNGSGAGLTGTAASLTAGLANGVNQHPNRTDGAWYQINWNNAASGADNNLYSSAAVTLLSSGYGAIGFNSSTWYIQGNATYGLSTNTGFAAAAGLWDAGSRVCSGVTCNIGSTAITSGLINGQTISSAANFTGTVTTGGNASIGSTNSRARLDIDGQVAGLMALYASIGNASGALPTTINSNGNSALAITANMSGGQGEMNLVNANIGAAGWGGISFNQMTSGSAFITTMISDKTGQLGTKVLAAGTSNSLCYNTTALSGVNTLATCSSDERLKQSITSIDGTTALSQVMQLNPVSFYWNPSFDTSGKEQFGLLAQQVEQIWPNLVSITSPTALTPDGTLSLNFNGLYAPIIASIQELNRRTKFIENAATSTVLFADVAGNVGVGTSAPTAKLTVSGNIFATAYEASPAIATSFPSTSLGTGTSTMFTAEIPAAVLTAAGNVDLYKLATYNLSGIEALAAKIDGQETRIASLESRMTALESGAISSASGSPISTTSIASALESFSGILNLQKLVANVFYATQGFIDHLTTNNVTVGTAATPAGVTLYDTVTKEPYCFGMSGGVATTTSGACPTVDATVNPFAATDSTSSTSSGQASSPQATTNTQGSTSTSNSQDQTLQATSTTTTATTTPTSSDTIAPVVTLNGEAAMQLTVGDTFTDPGATAIDDTDGDLTSKIVETGSVDTATAGSYSFTYSATDAAGNIGSAGRLVTVIAPPIGSGQAADTTASSTPST